MTIDSRSSGLAGPYSSDFDAQWEQIAETEVSARPTIPIGPPISLGKERVVEIGAKLRKPRQRRRGTRFPAHLPALLITADKHKAVHCTAINLSLSGALLRMSGRPLERQPWRLCLALPGGVLNTWARPVRSNPRGQAFEFIDLAARERTQIATYIHDCCAKASNGPARGLWRLG
jgi:hypothetical protein